MSNFIDYTNDTGGTTGDLSNYYTKAQTNTFVSNNNAIVIAKPELELAFKQAYNTMYKEPIREGKTIIQINIYENSSKALKLFTKTFTRVNNLVTQITITDELTGHTLIKGFTWLNGEWQGTNISYGGL